MKTIYLDIFSGISGDMFIGAMLDLGADFKQLQREPGKLKLEGYHLHAARKQKANIEGVKFDVHLEHDRGHEHSREQGHHSHSHSHEHAHAGHKHEHEHQHHQHGAHGHEHEHEHDEHAHDDSRNFSEITKLIHASDLSAWVKEK